MLVIPNLYQPSWSMLLPFSQFQQSILSSHSNGWLFLFTRLSRWCSICRSIVPSTSSILSTTTSSYIPSSHPSLFPPNTLFGLISCLSFSIVFSLLSYSIIINSNYCLLFILFLSNFLFQKEIKGIYATSKENNTHQDWKQRKYLYKTQPNRCYAANRL